MKAVAIAGALILLACVAMTAAAQEPQMMISSQPYRPGSIVFNSSSNEVDVAVVVRDAGGHDVAGLTRDDFVLLRDGKQQAIASFFVDQSAAAAAPSAPGGAPVAAAPAAARPQAAALFFDDNSLTAVGLAEVRAAAERFLAQGIPAGTRVGVFTASGSVTQPFTLSPEKLRTAVLRLGLHPRMTPNAKLSQLYQNAYLAYMTSQVSSSTLSFSQIAAGRAQAAGMCNGQDACNEAAQATARSVLAQATAASHDTFQALLRVIARLAAQPGRRTLLLASPGFLTVELGPEQDEVENAALRAGVVIDSLDAKMLSAHGPMGKTGPVNLALAQRQAMDSVMVSLAQATGGRFIQNTNDLAGGIRSSLAPQVRYEISFIPAAMPADGKFHNISVKLKPPHLLAAARRGYFDPQVALPPLDPATRAELAHAVGAMATPDGFPIAVTGGPLPGSQGLARLGIHVHIDAAELPFAKVDGRERESLVAIAAVYGAHGRYIVGQQGRVGFALTPATLKNVKKTGIDTHLVLWLRPGQYRLRVVVRDGNQGLLAAKNAAVQLPADTVPPKTTVPPAPPRR